LDDGIGRPALMFGKTTSLSRLNTGSDGAHRRTSRLIGILDPRREADRGILRGR
jgi:hypothetical protein